MGGDTSRETDMNWNSLKSLLISRAAQLIARYVAVLLVAWAGVSSVHAAPLAAIVAYVVVAAALFAADLWLHATKSGKAVCDEAKQIASDPEVAAELENIFNMLTSMAMASEKTGQKVAEIHEATVPAAMQIHTFMPPETVITGVTATNGSVTVSKSPFAGLTGAGT